MHLLVLKQSIAERKKEQPEEIHGMSHGSQGMSRGNLFSRVLEWCARVAPGSFGKSWDMP